MLPGLSLSREAVGRCDVTADRWLEVIAEDREGAHRQGPPTDIVVLICTSFRQARVYVGSNESGMRGWSPRRNASNDENSKRGQRSTKVLGRNETQVGLILGTRVLAQEKQGVLCNNETKLKGQRSRAE